MSPTAPLQTAPADLTAAQTHTIVLLFPGHMLTDHLAYGDGLVAFGFISGLARRGHRLHVIAQRVDFKVPLPANVTIHIAGAAGGSPVVERCVFIMRSRAIVHRLLRTKSIDLVHQLNPVNNGMSLGLIGLGLPVILGTFVAKWPAEPETRPRVLAGVMECLGGLAHKAVLRLQEQAASAFLVTTPAALSRFSSATRVAGRVHWLPHGVDVSAFVPLPPGIGADTTILFLASVAVKKGIFTLLDAFERVRCVIPTAKLIIAGDGPALDEVRQFVPSLPSVAHISILGPVDRSLVPQFMADAAVYCLPSFGEPYATTVIEAMACAKPIVVTSSGGLRDMIDERGGRRVEPGDVAQLADALIEILRSAALREEMGAHNRATVERDYDWPRVIEKLEGIYEWVLRLRAAR